MLMSVILNWGKRPWCWERLKAGGEGDDRRWDGWMASLTGWTWVWVSSRSRWWTGKPDVLQSTGSKRVGHDWVTDVNWDYEPRGHLEMSRGIFGCQSWHGRWHGQGASSGRRSGMPLSSLQCTGQHRPQRMTPPPMPTVLRVRSWIRWQPSRWSACWAHCKWVFNKNWQLDGLNH